MRGKHRNPEDTPLAAIVNFRRALWRLAQHMGPLNWYDEYGVRIVSSDWTNAEGDSLWRGEL